MSAVGALDGRPSVGDERFVELVLGLEAGLLGGALGARHGVLDAHVASRGREGGVLGEVAIPDEALDYFIAPSREEKLRYARHIRYCDEKMAESVARLGPPDTDAPAEVEVPAGSLTAAFEVMLAERLGQAAHTEALPRFPP